MSISGNTGKKETTAQNIVLPKILTNTLDQLHDPYVIKDLESRFIYANHSVAKLFGLRSPRHMLDKQENEIQSPLTESPTIVDEWQQQDRRVMQSKKHISMLEIHPKQLEYPYIIRKLPFYNEKDECIGVVMYSRNLECFNLKKYIRINTPSSLLLNKPDDFFTEEECEVVFLKLQRMTSKEIGHILQLSPVAVDERLALLYKKTNVNHSDDFSAFCHQRNYHRYLPASFIQQQKNVFKKDNYFMI